MKKAVFACLVLPLLAVGSQARQDEKPRNAGGRKKVHLEGFVFDGAGKPIAGVSVSALVSGASGSAGTTRTDATGKYAFDIDAAAPFDITYHHSQHYLGVVEYLADKKDQQISTVLYKRGQRMPASAAHAYYQALERLAFHASTLPRGDLKPFIGAFPAVLKPESVVPIFSIAFTIL
jgi:hypothetical protein